MIQYLWLIPLGFMVGAFGTLIGAGGGFILVPILLLLYPDKSPETITSISLAVVFFNALSGSFAYARSKKIDYKSGIIFVIANLPGAIIGTFVVSYIPRHTFNIVFGIILIAVSIYLALKPANQSNKELKQEKGYILREITDAEGKKYIFSYNPVLGVLISFVVGFMSSILGIGGGIIHVPAMIHLLSYPVHIATATSHFILVFMSFSSSLIHLVKGVLTPGLYLVIPLSLGVIFGAQLGAKLSKRMKGSFIVRGLALALALVGIRILLMSFLG